jgi:hypothetical protein
MKRRDVLKAGTAAGVAGALASAGGCATGAGLFQRPPDGPMPDLDELLPRFDRVMAATQSAAFGEQFAPVDVSGMDDGARAGVAAKQDLVRRCVRALYVTGTFLDLPEQTQLHPDVQARMLEYVPELDETIYGVVDVLRDMPEEDRRSVRRTLRARPDLPMETAAQIGTFAKLGGVSRTRRLQIRSMMTQAGWRLSKQNPSIVIDEYVDKIEKIAPRDASDAELQRRLTAVVGTAAIERAQAYSLGVAPGASPPKRKRSQQPTPTTPGQRTAQRGAKALGLGVLVFASGAAVIGLGSVAGIFALTAGAVLFAIGLLVMLAGIFQSIGE